jgi:hypothetical protein
VPDDVMKNAVITASVVYHLANRDKMIPRFAPDAMPPLPAGRGGAGGGRGNAAPSAQPHLFAATKNKPLTVKAPGLLPALAAGAPPQTAAVASRPAHGKLELKPDGSFVYTPSKDFTGTDTFTYTIASGGATSAAGTVTITVK